MTQNPEDQRSLYRIKDTVTIDFELVSESDVRKHAAEYFFPASIGHNLIKGLYSLDEGAAHILRILDDEQREVAAYLKMINKKVDLIARHIAENNQVQQGSLQENISLSEGGVSFMVDSPIDANSYMAMKLTMLPSYLGLMLYARVVECHQLESGGQYHISASFISATEHDTRILARHIMQVQATERRLRQKSED